MTDRWRGLSRDAVIELHAYALARLQSDEQLAISTVERELPGLRWLLWRSMERGGPDNLTKLVGSPDLVAVIFREPSNKDASETSGYLHAYRKFLRATLPAIEAQAAFAAIEDLLIPRKGEWHQAERRAGGLPPTQRALRLLSVEDLLAVIARAVQGKRGEHALRDDVAVVLWCFSPLRPREIVALDWEHLSFHEVADGMPFGAWAHVARHNRMWDLPLHTEASKRLALLYGVTERAVDRKPTGAVLRTLRRPCGRLSYREVRDIVFEACAAVAPNIRRRELLAAYAHHLMRRYGYTVPDLREALGLSDVVSADRLVAAHVASRLELEAKSLEAVVSLLPAVATK